MLVKNTNLCHVKEMNKREGKGDLHLISRIVNEINLLFKSWGIIFKYIKEN